MSVRPTEALCRAEPLRLECIQVLQRLLRSLKEINSARQLKVNTCATVMRCNRPCRIRRAAHPQNLKLTTEPETTLLDLQAQRKQRFFEALTWLKREQSWLLWSRTNDRGCVERNAAKSMTGHTYQSSWLNSAFWQNFLLFPLELRSQTRQRTLRHLF